MADSNTYSFRTALQGFNRADVVHFIEQNTAAHEAELRQLQLENSRLAQQLNDANAYIGQLQQTVTSLQQAPAAPAAVPEPVLPPLEQETPPSQYEELELAAYRRAEQVERKARERAAVFYQKIDDLVAKTNDQLAQDDKSLGSLAGELGANIAALQQVMAKIRATLDDSTHFLKQLDLPAADDAE